MSIKDIITVPDEALKKISNPIEKVGVNEKKLNILGLMIIPPNDENTSKYFQEASNLNTELGLKELSMGMSSDYKLAIKYKATYLRIGSGILGQRSLNR